jgi:hypothetical protein
MGKHRNKPPIEGDFEVGYRKPPKHTQFKAKGADPGEARKPRRKGKKTLARPIDVYAILNQRMPIAVGGKQTTMGAHEISLRKLLKRAISDRDRSALKQIVSLALEFGIVKPPPEAKQPGGVIMITKYCPDEIARMIALRPDRNDKDYQEGSDEAWWDLVMQWGLDPRKYGGGSHD